MEKRSELSDGGHRTTESVKTSTFFGTPQEFHISNDYDKYGNWTGGVKVDPNGTFWRLNSSGNTVEELGDDGRFDD